MDKIKRDDIQAVSFAKDVVSNVNKQITTVPFIDSEGVIVTEKLEYPIQFNVAGCGLKHIINMATLNSKTDIGNNLRSRCKKDVDNGHNDTLDFFKNMLDDSGKLIVDGFPTGLPDVPVSPEARQRTIVAQYTLMDDIERKALIEALQEG